MTNTEEHESYPNIAAVDGQGWAYVGTRHEIELEKVFRGVLVVVDFNAQREVSEQ